MSHRYPRRAAGLLMVVASLLAAPAMSSAVWHCSRAALMNESAPLEADSFQLSSASVNPQAIGISLGDLIDAYSGKTIQVNARALTACFMPGDTALSVQALGSLGLNASSLQQMARKSAIVQSSLQGVIDEAGMLACVAKGYPAVGYLSQPVTNERVVPCF